MLVFDDVQWVPNWYASPIWNRFKNNFWLSRDFITDHNFIQNAQRNLVKSRGTLSASPYIVVVVAATAVVVVVAAVVVKISSSATLKGNMLRYPPHGEIFHWETQWVPVSWKIWSLRLPTFGVKNVPLKIPRTVYYQLLWYMHSSFQPRPTLINPIQLL